MKASFFFTLHNGISVAIFPGNVFTDIDSLNIDNTYVSHSHTYLLLSSSGRYSMLICQDMRRIHVTEYIPSAFKGLIQQLLEFRNQYCTSDSIFLSPRFSPLLLQSSMKLPALSSASFQSLWLIFSKNIPKKQDNWGWNILAEDLDGHFLSICPFSLRLRLRWVHILLSSTSSAYVINPCCDFEVVETLFSNTTNGPLCAFVKILYRHCYHHQFLASPTHSITVPYFSSGIGLQDIQEQELHELQAISPYCSTIRIHQSTSSEEDSPFQVSHLCSSSLFVPRIVRIHGVDIVYCSASTSTSNNGGSEVLLRDMVPVIFPTLEEESYSVLYYDQNNSTSERIDSKNVGSSSHAIATVSPLATVWVTPSADNSHQDNILLLVRAETVELHTVSSASPTVMSYAFNRDLCTGIITNDMVVNSSNSKATFPRSASEALQWICYWCRTKPSLFEALFLFNSALIGNALLPCSLATLRSKTEDVEVIEAQNRVRFSVFYESDCRIDDNNTQHGRRNVSRVRALFRQQQVILDYNVANEVFTACLSDGSVQMITLAQIDDIEEAELGQQCEIAGWDLPSSVTLPMIRYVFVCLRQCRTKLLQPGASISSNTDTINHTSNDVESQRLQHEDHLKRLCHATLRRSQQQSVLYHMQQEHFQNKQSNRTHSIASRTTNTAFDATTNTLSYDTPCRQRMSFTPSANESSVSSQCSKQQNILEQRQRERQQEMVCMQLVRDALNNCREVKQATQSIQTTLNLRHGPHSVLAKTPCNENGQYVLPVVE